jgi:hypothetical protein
MPIRFQEINADITKFILFGAFMTELQNVHTGSIMFVCPATCQHVTAQKLSNRFEFNFILGSFTKFIRTFWFWLKSDSSNRYIA